MISLGGRLEPASLSQLTPHLQCCLPGWKGMGFSLGCRCSLPCLKVLVVVLTLFTVLLKHVCLGFMVNFLLAT